MTTNKKIALAVLCLLVVALAILAYAYEKHRSAVTAEVPAPVLTTPSDASATPILNIPGAKITQVSKVAVPNNTDGTFTVEIQSITTDSEQSTITFSHVNYFQGAEATAAAKKDFPCGANPETYCVQTLAYGYFVQSTHAPTFTVPVTANTSIVLTDNPHATVMNLRNLARPFPPVFDIVVKDGNLVSITERPMPKVKS